MIRTEPVQGERNEPSTPSSLLQEIRFVQLMTMMMMDSRFWRIWSTIPLTALRLSSFEESVFFAFCQFGFASICIRHQTHLYV